MHWALTCPSPGPIDVVPLDIMVPRSITDVLEVIAATPVIEEQKNLPVPLPEGGDNDEDGDVGDEGESDREKRVVETVIDILQGRSSGGETG
eukprot:28831-Eustigmatos_ZCMA.PRE.1